MSAAEQGQAVPDVGAASPRLVGRAAWDAAALGVAILRAWREVCTLRSVVQLDALPAGSVVRAGGTMLEASGRPGGQANAWVAVGVPYRWTADEVSLPALLVWHPGWGA